MSHSSEQPVLHELNCSFSFLQYFEIYLSPLIHDSEIHDTYINLFSLHCFNLASPRSIFKLRAKLALWLNHREAEVQLFLHCHQQTVQHSIDRLWNQEKAKNIELAIQWVKNNFYLFFHQWTFLAGKYLSSHTSYKCGLSSNCQNLWHLASSKLGIEMTSFALPQVKHFRCALFKANMFQQLQWKAHIICAMDERVVWNKSYPEMNASQVLSSPPDSLRFLGFIFIADLFKSPGEKIDFGTCWKQVSILESYSTTHAWRLNSW